MVLKILLCFLFGYLIGGINPAYVIGRLRGIDIRKKGSKNAGASNAVILLGKTVGVAIALFDIGKAAASFWLAPVIFNQFGGLPLAAEIAGVGAIIGHIFPVYMKFRGGKGTACLGGVLLAIDWRLFLIALFTEILLVVATDYLCLLPITIAIAIPVIYGLCGEQGNGWLLNATGGWWGAAVLSVASAVILIMNIKNIRRIIHGTEMHLSYAWSKNKPAEIERIQANEKKWEEKKAAKRQAREGKPE